MFHGGSPEREGIIRLQEVGNESSRGLADEFGNHYLFSEIQIIWVLLVATRLIYNASWNGGGPAYGGVGNTHEEEAGTDKLWLWWHQRGRECYARTHNAWEKTMTTGFASGVPSRVQQ